MHKSFSALTILLLVSSSGPAAGQFFQEIYSFQPFGTNGDGPYGGLNQASDGSFYGTTYYGGTWDYGTVFRMTPEGLVTAIASFDATNTNQHPYTGLVQAGDGNLYGSTWESALFTATPAGQITTVGWAADSALYAAADRCLYGSDGGTVFRFYPATEEQIVIRAFNPNYPQSTNGYNPSGSPVQARDGNFYGVTSDGGAYGYGVAYRLATNGTYTVLCSFSRGPATNDAVNPYGRLLLASDGNFYGVAGADYEDGYIFRLTTNGVLTTLVRFGTGGTWGRTPNEGLIEANDGNFYGTTMYGGSDSLGTVFRLTPAGVITTIVSFTESGGPYPGATPHAGLLQASDGNLYGTTANAGSRGAGNIFRIIMPGPQLTLNSLPSSLNQIVLSWRTNYTSFTLQSSADLSSGVWLDCTNTAAVSVGQFFVTNTISGGAQFFRLKK
jgi:uncharacterized repeat protein (TIGR03803 family)